MYFFLLLAIPALAIDIDLRTVTLSPLSNLPGLSLISYIQHPNYHEFNILAAKSRDADSIVESDPFGNKTTIWTKSHKSDSIFSFSYFTVRGDGIPTTILVNNLERTIEAFFYVVYSKGVKGPDGQSVFVREHFFKDAGGWRGIRPMCYRALQELVNADRLVDRYVDRQIDKPVDRSGDRSIDLQVDRSAVRSNDRPAKLAFHATSLNLVDLITTSAAKYENLSLITTEMADYIKFDVQVDGIGSILDSDCSNKGKLVFEGDVKEFTYLVRKWEGRAVELKGRQVQAILRVRGGNDVAYLLMDVLEAKWGEVGEKEWDEVVGRVEVKVRGVEGVERWIVALAVLVAVAVLCVAIVGVVVVRSLRGGVGFVASEPQITNSNE